MARGPERAVNHGRMRKESQALSAGTPEVCRPIFRLEWVMKNGENLRFD
jgi:hypothetical protein